MKELIYVTSNDNKAREIAETLGVTIKRVNIELDEIQEMDLKKIIRHKTLEAYGKLKSPVIVEDVGFYIDDWNGFPGPLIKWFHATVGYDKLTKMLSKKNRNAEFLVAYGLYDGKKFYSFVGSSKGKIATSPRGEGGWGFDTIFIPQGYRKTFAELGGSIKLKISARRIALEKLRRFIKKNRKEER
jgi:XTP/dITP diphosphohydrolase